MLVRILMMLVPSCSNFPPRNGTKYVQWEGYADRSRQQINNKKYAFIKQTAIRGCCDPWVWVWVWVGVGTGQVRSYATQRKGAVDSKVENNR